jgi:hypothetical protein
MGLRGDEYRRKAEEADKLAEAAKDQVAGQMYRDIATKWRALAEQADRYGL